MSTSEAAQLYFSCEAEGAAHSGKSWNSVGEDVVVFASDFPHWDSSFPRNLHEPGRSARI